MFDLLRRLFDTLPSEQGGEEEMPEITCVGCGNGHVIVYHGYEWASGRLDSGVIRGSLICHHPVPSESRYVKDHPCNATTVFEITGSSVSFLQGKLFDEDQVTSHRVVIRVRHPVDIV